MIAALYVETNGVYFGLPNVDPWDVTKDARLYGGPWPVVAHPPCATWGRLRRQAVQVEGGCFVCALDSVRRFGGVLEHPAYSSAFRLHRLPYAIAGRGWTEPDAYGGRSIWVPQSNYGHVTPKETFLYAVGVDFEPLDVTPRPARKRLADIPKGFRRNTPIPFRDLLIRMAESVVL